MVRGNRFPLLLEEVATVVSAQLERRGLPGLSKGDIDRIGQACAEHIRSILGGRWHFVPKGHRYDLSLRDREIYSQFNGANLRELAEAHDLTLVRLYQIIQQMRLEERERRAEEDADQAVSGLVPKRAQNGGDS